MRAGRLIGVVGPSGVGKDSVMTALAQSSPELGLVRRVITRAPELSDEDFQSVSVGRFEELKSEGLFCLSWCAHDLFYGIPKSVHADLEAGRDLLVNLSRKVLCEADAAFDRFLVVSLSARPETLAERLAARGRESSEAIARRLARPAPALPSGLEVLTISNDGPLDATVEALRAALYPARV